ncbi:hypothetical protein [Vibrio sp. LaRot3]|uniref:hypothetical protein n=1 Tax=Vibrio sp. LaRot3 TaxID=2998829 RepID=UPI0022CDC304|nr:hypothetical protein [Vibrio sp. LaRot3]MDA0148437.1 hypothetical protein [Vibrio sp. LaRot3]
MNFIKNPFTKNKAEPVDLAPVWKELQEGNFDRVIELASEHTTSKAKETVKESLKLIGLSYFHKELPEKALPYFKNAAKITPEVNDWFNVSTSATLANEIDVGREALNEAIKLQSESGHSQEPSIPYMKLYYACALRDVSEFRLAFDQIEELRPIYEQLKITDTTFLHIRGVPFLSHTVETAIDIFKGLGDSVNALEWLKQFSYKLDEDGQKYIAEVSANFTTNKALKSDS